MTAFLARLRRQPWIWSFLAALAVWLITIAFTRALYILFARLAFELLTLLDKLRPKFAHT